LCAKLSTVTPQANSPCPEFALEIAPPIHPGFRPESGNGMEVANAPLS
jgi:hypothetical protein